MKKFCFSLVLLLTLPPVVVHAESAQGVGSFMFKLHGYTIQGQLFNAFIHPNGSVSIMMSIDYSLQTQIGAVPISGQGQWEGTLNGGRVSGTIENVQGSLQLCYIICGYADYIGKGTWAGTISRDEGTGIFGGTKIFTGSSIPEVPLNRATSVSGNWASSFQ